MSNSTSTIRSEGEGDRVSLDQALFERILDVLTFTASAASDTEHWRASERAALLLIDINVAMEGGVR